MRVPSALAVSRRRASSGADPIDLADVAAEIDTRPALDIVDSRLHLNGCDLNKVATRWGTPTHATHSGLIEAAAQAAIAGPCDVFTSYKTNPIPNVLTVLHGVGIGAEVISPFELWLAFELNVDPQRIIYNGPAKSDASLIAACEAGILLINANSAGDMDRIEYAARITGTVARVGVRIALDHMWGGQFGLRGDGAEVRAVIGRAMASPHLDLVGIHAHRGHRIDDAPTMLAHVEAVTRCLVELRHDTGWYPRQIDLGGSLASSRRDTLDISAAAELANAVVTTTTRQLGGEAPTVILEPGRSLTGHTQVLLAEVLDVNAGTGDIDAEVVIDVGVGQAEPVRSGDHPVLPLDDPLGRRTRVTRLVGPGPDDLMLAAAQLPEFTVGDIVAIVDTGAYFVPFSFAPARPRPSIVDLATGSEWRAREPRPMAYARDLNGDGLV